MRYLVEFIESESRRELGGELRGKNGESLVNGPEIQFCKMKKKLDGTSYTLYPH